MSKELCLLLLILCNAFMLSRTENDSKGKSFYDEEQAAAWDGKENNSSNLWDEERKIASNLRTRIRNTVNRFSTRTPNLNFPLFDQNTSIGLVNRPIRRWRLRLKNRRENANKMNEDNSIVEMQPEKVDQAFEPLKIMPTGLEMVGTAEDVVNKVIENTNLIMENKTNIGDLA